MRRLLVLVVLTSVASCANSHLTRCSERPDRSLDCSYQDLHEANLVASDLPGANLEGANLEGANLEGADLYGADLYGANLEGAIFGWAIADQDTQWPEGFDPVAAGVVFE